MLSKNDFKVLISVITLHYLLANDYKFSCDNTSFNFNHTIVRIGELLLNLFFYFSYNSDSDFARSDKNLLSDNVKHVNVPLYFITNQMDQSGRWPGLRYTIDYNRMVAAWYTSFDHLTTRCLLKLCRCCLERANAIAILKQM